MEELVVEIEKTWKGQILWLSQGEGPVCNSRGSQVLKHGRGKGGSKLELGSLSHLFTRWVFSTCTKHSF